MKPFHLVAARLCLLGGLLAAHCAWAEAASAPVAAPATAPAAAPAAHDMTATDVEAWLDGLMPTALHNAQTPGAVVVIVKDGQILVEKGYGYADLKKHLPVDPRNTLFRPGSTSKLFTWTAVMQLVEQGKLDLDADVNKYLDFQIPPRDGKPITLRQVMTHTTGLEETIKDLIAFDEPMPSLGAVLKSYVPPRRADAGSTSGYSNYAAALAGYIVERVSGMPFDDYVEKNIFGPLAMNSSSFRQPLPPALLARMATGYENKDKVGKGYELVDMPPAGSLASTGDDMAHFMIAHLQEGKYGNGQILKPETAHQMHDSITRLFPDLNGIALGFYEQNINGHRVIAHGGDLNYFHTDLALFLDDHVGVFVSVNAIGKEGMGEMLRESLFQEFADRYYPKPEPVVTIDAATAKEHAKLIAGTYFSTRRADSTFLSLVGLIAPTTVTANEDGSITTKTLLDPLAYVEVKPFLWQQIDGHDKLQAIVKDGKVVRWSTNTLAFGFDFDAPGGLAGMGLEMPLCYAALAVLFVVALLWPAAAIARKKYKQALGYQGARAVAYHLPGATAVLSFASLGIWADFFSAIEASQSTHLDNFLHLAQLSALLAFGGGTLVALWNLMQEFKEGKKWPCLLWAVIRLAAFAYLLWIALHYHMIGFSSQY